MGKEQAVSILVGSREEPARPYSHMWRIFSRGTSFYVKARHPELGQFKVSLHGPDPRPELRPGFRFGVDRSVPATTNLLTGEQGHRGTWYEGEQMPGPSGARRVLRIRFGWDMFQPGMPAGLIKFDLSRGMTGALIKFPDVGYAVDVDFFVADGAPYWPGRVEKIRKANSAIKPIVNTANQFLTAVNVHRSMFRNPTPPTEGNLPPMSEGDLVRGVVAWLPEGGQFPWITELPVSRTAFRDLDAYRPPRAISTVGLTGTRMSGDS
ncbi:hypothetical protein [Oerskovia rustica]|uniref:Uncharacterized protein n=1 Tax=Oerskovia rustica TaxID=2762237 RepID=A0ABR8RP92_9CELL|nr:hypothetical protein [Oerskovia rustica]MBD7949605.1 hypothetical protein [Oerskovia rustica]